MTKNDLRHDYYDFMHSMGQWMSSEYARIQKRVLEDPGTAGDQVEENWANFLQNWLPANYPIVTKGRIMGYQGETSPQIDIIVLHPSYPLSLRDKKLYFAGGVLAAFECKLNLRTRDIKKSCKNAAIVKSLIPSRKGTPYDELHQPVLFGILAHSMDIKSKDEKPHYTLVEKIHNIAYDALEELAEIDEKYIHPKYLLDYICVVDVATITLNKQLFIGHFTDPNHEIPETDIDDVNGFVETSYMANWEENEQFDLRGNILGTLVSDITTRFAFDDPPLQRFAEYLRSTAIYGSIGRCTYWNSKVLSEEVINTLISRGYENYPFSKWRRLY